MRNKVILFSILTGSLLVLAFMAIAISETSQDSTSIQILNKEAANHTNEFKTYTNVPAIKITKKPEGSLSLKKEVMVTMTSKEKINIEPVLKKIIESGFQPSSGIARIETAGTMYMVPPDVDETVLVKLYISNKPVQSLYDKLETLGACSIKYYQGDGFIKARIPITNVITISSLPEITDVRRMINFPLATQGYNIRTENGNEYYHVFLSVEGHESTDAMLKTLDDFGVEIKKIYHDGITDFRVHLPVDNIIQVAELPFVTHIEYHDVPVECELYMSKKVTDIDYIRDNIDPDLKGSGVRLAVIDTGIDHHHPYLPTPIYELDIRDDMANDGYAEDDYGHGTHVIGIIANNYYTPSRYEGIAPDIELAVIKATGEPGPSGDVNQQIYDAIDYAVNDAHAQVISMSLGIAINNNLIINSDGTTMWEQKVDWATRNGVIFIKSAGNRGVDLDQAGTIISRNYDSISCPGTAKNVISVGATNHWFAQDDDVSIDNTIFGTQIDEMTVYSSRGDTGDSGYENGRNKPEVVAPGGACAWTNDNNGDGFIEDIANGVVSARGKTDDQSNFLEDVDGDGIYYNDNLYRMKGTSMAAPHVAGIAALVIDTFDFTKSNENAALVKAMIVGSGINIGDNDLIANRADNNIDDDIGYGKVDAYQAICSNPNRTGIFYTGSIDSTEYNVHTFTIPDDRTYQHIKITVTWNDPPTASTDPVYGALLNDIDIRLYSPDDILQDSSENYQQNIEQITYYDANGITPGDWELVVIATDHWDSPQEYGCDVLFYTDTPSIHIIASSDKNEMIEEGDQLQLTATVNNTGGEVASAVIISFNLHSPDGHSIEDFFTINSGYQKTLLGNIPPSGSRSVSWTLTAKDTIPKGTPLVLYMNATYSNTGSTSDASLVINGHNIRLEGDVTNTGLPITGADAQLIAQHIVHTITLTGENAQAADVNDDLGGSTSHITGTDLQLIKQYIVHMINEFPGGDYIP